MIIYHTERFRKSYGSASKAVQKSCDKQLFFLVKNIRHPSLYAKKYDETYDIWQARINDDWRFYFTIQGNVYILINMTHHPK